MKISSGWLFGTEQHANGVIEGSWAIILISNAFVHTLRKHFCDIDLLLVERPLAFIKVNVVFSTLKNYLPYKNYTNGHILFIINREKTLTPEFKLRILFCMGVRMEGQVPGFCIL